MSVTNKPIIENNLTCPFFNCIHNFEGECLCENPEIENDTCYSLDECTGLGGFN